MRTIVSRGVVVATLLSLGIGACHLGSVEDVPVVLPPIPPAPGTVGACKATPSALAHLSGILTSPGAIDSTNLYVLSSAEADGSTTHSIWRIPKDGSAPQPVVTSDTPIAAFGLRDDGFPQSSAVLWTTPGPSDADGGPVGSVKSITLGTAKDPVTIASDRRSPGALAVLDDHVYWAEQEVDPSGQNIEAIVKAPMDGGTPTRVQTFDAGDIPRRLLPSSYWSDTLDALVENLFWSTWNFQHGTERSSEIARAEVSPQFGPQFTVVVADAGGAAATQVADDFPPSILYSGPRGIFAYVSASDGGPGVSFRIVETDGFVDRIADDDTHVYFVSRSTGRLMAAPLYHRDAEAPRVIAESVDPESEILVDPSCVYWIDPGAQTIMMTTK